MDEPQMTLTVVGPTATRTSRVLWCLEELGLSYDHQIARPHSPEINALNPLKQVPVLKDGDAVLTDSTAILYHLSDRENRLTHSPGSHARAKMDARIAFLLTELEAPLWMRSRHSYVLPKDMRHPEVFPLLEVDFKLAEEKFIRLLDGADFFGGDTFTIADIIAAHCLFWATDAHDLAETSTSYLDRMKARAAWTASQKNR
jgi:glutathione S-transferase